MDRTMVVQMGCLFKEWETRTRGRENKFKRENVIVIVPITKSGESGVYNKRGREEEMLLV